MKKFASIFSIAVFMFSSCNISRYVYSPASQNVPKFTKANDSKFAIYNTSNITSTVKGYDVQAAYALSNSIALQTNFYKRIENQNSTELVSILSFENHTINYKRNLTELAIGYYHYFAPSKILVQTYFGYGIGKFNFNDVVSDSVQILNSYYHYSNVNNYFLQPSITFLSKGTFSVSLSNKINLVSYKNISTNYSLNQLSQYHLDSLTNNPHIFTEPCFMISFGSKKMEGVLLEMQMIASILANNPVLNYHQYDLSIGLVFDIPKFIKSIKALKK